MERELEQISYPPGDVSRVSESIQGTVREQSGNSQGTFREHSRNIQETFRDFWSLSRPLLSTFSVVEFEEQELVGKAFPQGMYLVLSVCI
jgi:hypothetical protein